MEKIGFTIRLKLYNQFCHTQTSSATPLSWLSACTRVFSLLFVGAAIGMASLYLYNPGEFWATVDKVDHHFQPLGANMLWPNFQVRGIIFLHTRVNSRFDNQVTHSNPAIFLSKNHLNLPYERHYNPILMINLRFQTQKLNNLVQYINCL